ncbi:transposase [Streptomyces sp. NPDC058289]|uniref:transposase n=1 Tax=Streptomyces sp. NPDC058289 TaxID=3346425 RepID=UPI0036E7714A
MSDAEWERLRPFLSVSNGRCGRRRDHRRVINGILHRGRTGVHQRDLPERFPEGPAAVAAKGAWQISVYSEPMCNQRPAVFYPGVYRKCSGDRGRRFLGHSSGLLVLRSAVWDEPHLGQERVQPPIEV